MRLRPLTEAECYARCYGGRRGEAANFVRVLSHAEPPAPRAHELLREALEPGALAGRVAQGLEAA